MELPMSKDLPQEDPDTEAGTGSGRGGDLGHPDPAKPSLPPPSLDQEENEVVSGGGVADQGDDDHR